MSIQQLTISLSRTSVHVAEVLRSTQVVVQEYSNAIPAGTPEEITNSLKLFFDGLKLSSDYSDVSVAWTDSNSFLIPENVFHASNAKELFQFVIGEEVDPRDIDYNRLPELSAVVVYTIPLWVKSFVIRRFPKAFIQHEKGMMIRSLFQQETYRLKLCVVLMEGYLSVHVLHKNELIFSNSFSYQSKEDVMYYLLYVLQQKELMAAKGTLMGYGLTKQEVDMLEEVYKDLISRNILPDFKTVPLDNLTKTQLQCV